MYAILNADKIKKHQADVVTARNGEDVLENGAIVALGKLEDAGLGRDTYKIEKLSATTVKWGMIDCVALMYDETKDERDFRLEAGEIARVRRFPAGGAMTIAKKHVAGSVVEGDLLALNEHDGQKCTGNSCLVYVDYIFSDATYVKEDMIIMSIKPCTVYRHTESFNPALNKTDYSVPLATG